MKEMTNKKKTMIAVVTALVIAVIILILALMGCQSKDAATPDEVPATLTTETVPQQEETENITAENTEKSTVSTNANTENNNNNTKPTNNTSSTTSKVENNKPVSSNTNTDNKKPDTNASSNTSSNTSTKTWHEAEYKYIEHPAETKTEKVWVVDKEAYTYEEPVYEKHDRTICNTCGADITDDCVAHGKSHVMNFENFSYHNEWVNVQVGTKTVEVPEEGHWETKTTVIKEAWTEKVLVREAGYY